HYGRRRTSTGTRSARISPAAAEGGGFGSHGKAAGKGSRGLERSRTNDISLYLAAQFAVADPSSRVDPGLFPLSLLFSRASDNDHKWCDRGEAFPTGGCRHRI